MSLVVFGFACLLAGAADCAADERALDAEYTVRSWQTEQGLPQNSVPSITSDRDGFLWCGTEEGLARFDGAKFSVFDSRNTPGLSHSSVWTVLPGPDGSSVLFGTEGGGLFESRQGRINVVAPADQLQSGIVNKAYVDRDGGIWVATREGLSRFKGGKVQRWNAADGLANAYVRSVYQDASGRIWVGTYGGLNYIAEGVVRPAPWPELLHANVRAICQTPSGQLYFGTNEAGLFEVAGETVVNYRQKDGIGHDTIADLAVDGEGSLWMATYGGGVTRLRNGEFASLTEKQGLPNGMCVSVYPDRDGLVWVGHNGAGLSCLHPRQVTMINRQKGLAADIALAILQTKNGDLWVGTASGGVTRFHDGSATSFDASNGLPGKVVLALGEDQQGGVWIGTAGGKGVARYDADGRFTIFTKADGLPNNTVTAVLADKQGRVVLGTEAGGLSIYDGKEFKSIGRSDGLSNETIICLLEAKDGDLWIGTRGGGVNRIRRDGKIDVFLGENAGAQEVFALHQDSLGDIWAATGRGVFRISTSGAIAQITTAQGLHENQIMAMTEDEFGYLWMSSNRGIARFSRQELSDLCDGKVARLRPILLGKVDGMESTECNGGVFPASARLQNGEILFPTMRGVAVINPRAIPQTRALNRPTVEKLTVDEQPRDLTKPIRLPASSRHFEFVCSLPAFRAPERVLFRYRLDGLDEDWSPPTPQRTAHYTRLPAGSYTFKVDACDENGAWSAQEVAVNLQIIPPFYQTRLFQALIACAAVLVVLAIGHYLRLIQVRRHNAELEQKVADRTADLAGANLRLTNEVEERKRAEEEARQARVQAEMANHAKSEFLSRVSHELRTPLNAILGFGHLLHRHNPTPKQETYIRHVTKAGRHLLELINEVLDISRIEIDHLQLSLEPVCVAVVVSEAIDLLRPLATERMINLSTELDELGNLHVLADRQRLKQVMLNLLGNAVKYTEKGGDVTVSVAEPTAQRIRIVVADTGVGIPRENLPRLFTPFDRLGAEKSNVEGTGLGLALCQRLTKAMNGSIGVESEPGKGSTFWVELARAESPLQALATRKNNERPEIKNPGDDKKRTFLYIEDNLSNVALVEQMLADRPQTELLTAMQGQVGLDLAEQHRPDLVLLDLHLPDMPGWDVLASLRAKKRTRDIPVVVISADATRHQVTRLMAAGAHDYLTKPIDSAAFFNAIDEAVNSANKEPETSAAT